MAIDFSKVREQAGKKYGIKNTEPKPKIDFSSVREQAQKKYNIASSAKAQTGVDFSAVRAQAEKKYAQPGRKKAEEVSPEKYTGETDGIKEKSKIFTPKPASSYAAGYQELFKQPSTPYAAGAQAGLIKEPERPVKQSPVELPPEEKASPWAGMTAEEIRQVQGGLLQEEKELGKKLFETGGLQVGSSYAAASGQYQKPQENPYSNSAAVSGTWKDPEEEVRQDLREKKTALESQLEELGGVYYKQDRAEQLTKLQGDQDLTGTYRTAQGVDEDLWKVTWVLNGDPASDSRAAEYTAQLRDKYQTDDLWALAQELTAQKKALEKELDDSGVSYEKMTEYLSRLERAKEYQKKQEEQRQFAEDHPVGASIATIPATLFQGAEYFDVALKGIGHSDPAKLDSYIPADVYDMHATNFVRNVRGTVAEKVANSPVFAGVEIGGQNLGSFLYQTGMSMGDFLFNAMATGNFSGGLGGTGSELAKRAASDLSLAIMGSGAAANTTAEAIGRGLSNRQAYTLGAIAGMAEIVTEKVSLDTLLDKTSLNKSAWGYVAKNMLAEGSEEMASDLINWAGDVLVAKDKSQWKQAIQAYMDQGMGEKEAFQLALKDQLIDMGMDGLGGILSGGLMAGSGVAVDHVIDWMRGKGQDGRAHDVRPYEGMAAPETQAALRQAAEEMYRAREVQKTAPIPGAVRADRESYTVVERLRENIPGLIDMEPVASVSAQEVRRTESGQTMAGAARMLFDKIKGSVLRKGFGIVEITQRSVKDDLSHGIGPAKAAVIPAIPAVIQNGKQIDFQKGWKGRGYDGYVFAAPVVMDGDSVYVAAVVKRSSKNSFYLHEVVDSNGNIIKIDSDDGATPTSLAAKSDAGTPSPLSTDPIIPTLEDGVNREHAQGEMATEQTSLISDQALNELMNDQSFLDFLKRKGGLKLTKDMTQDQKRTAIREALGRAIQKKSVSETGLEKPEGNDILEKTEPDALFSQMGGLTDGRGEEGATGGIPGGEVPAGTPAQDGDRSGVPEMGAGVREERTEQTVSGNIFRRLTASFGQQPVKSWAKDAVIIPQEGSIAQGEQQVVGEFYVPSYVIRDDVWDKVYGEKAPAALASQGQIYFRATLSEASRDTYGFHEIIHVMEQMKFQPYVEFVQDTPEWINFTSKDAQLIIQGAAKHCGIDPFNMTRTERMRLYDEVNASLWGLISGGKTGPIEANLRQIFYDFDGYVAAMGSICEQFKAEQHRKFEAGELFPEADVKEGGDRIPDAPFRQPLEKEEEWTETDPSESERKRRFISEFTGHVTTRGRLRISYQEMPVIRSALKSGLCKINADGSTGRVRTSAKEYQFDVIDGDVIIYDAVDNDALNIHKTEFAEEYKDGR